MKLTESQLSISIRAVHEQGRRLHSMWCDSHLKDYRHPNGLRPTREERDGLFAEHRDHMELVEKLRFMRDNNEISGVQTAESMVELSSKETIL